jgi:hypothetical protein
MKEKQKETGIESELDCVQSNADSGATPIGSASRAPDEISGIKTKKRRRLTWFVDVGQIDSFKK